jgi:hypothetical protein
MAIDLFPSLATVMRPVDTTSSAMARRCSGPWSDSTDQGFSATMSPTLPPRLELGAEVPLEVHGMAESNTDGSTTKPTPSAEMVTTRVNVAFPFSQIRVQEPSEDLAALAALVRELADLLADVAPGSKAGELGERAQALATRLK